MPFTLRALETERSRFGIVECLNHSLLHPYPVLHEKANELARPTVSDVITASEHPAWALVRPGAIWPGNTFIDCQPAPARMLASE